MKYLITGGCGFIGVNFAEKILRRGDEVILLDNLSRRGTSTNLEYLKKIYNKVKFVHVDIRIDNGSLQKAVNQVDVVYHLASQVAVTTSVKDPFEDFYINALGTFNVLEAVRKSANKPILIYASTNKVYGGMEEISVIEGADRYTYKDFPIGIPESMCLDFHSPYGCSKGCGDQYVRDYARIYDLRTVVMRQSCIYGPRQFGIEDQGWVAWFVIAKLLGSPISIYGNGKQVRDVLYVDDLFSAWDFATKNPNITRGKVYNVGGGPRNTISLLEFLNLLGELTGSFVSYTFSDWRPGDQPVYISDISKIREELGWEPLTDVKSGVRKLIDWVRENEDLVRAQLSL
ncbi:GDP-mannose 4,6-dehydratase [Patescibacteria group bacterium]|nr:GDP-mannose 4,6-dehydratase [Patescibacteria group bacterium]